ncbi:MAG: response regulator [Chitinophagaceae bacterium]
MLYILSIFIVTIVLVVFLQYSSNSNINNLITGNQELLSEFVLKTKIQDLIEDLNVISDEKRKMISQNVRGGRENMARHIDTVLQELAYLKQITIHKDTRQKLNELDQPLTALLQCYKIELDSILKNAQANSDVILAHKKADTLSSKIVAISNELITAKDDHLISLIQLADQNAKEAKKWGVTLAVLAIIASIYAFWYINKKVTLQASLIKQLNESEKRVKEAASIKENFMANMSHEIRTPMNAILGFISILQKQGLDVKSREFTSSIKNASENLLTIVNDILDFSKIEAGMMRIESGLFNLKGLLHSVQTMFIEKAKDKKISLIVTTASDIPEVLKGDAVRLTQILVNLVGNAIKFTDSGEITVAVSNYKKEEEIIYLSFSIRDTGIGISKNMIMHVFERFNQADEDTTRKYGGTGLGLTIVKQLVELQKGNITVNSAEGKGSEFIFTIPYLVVKQETRLAESKIKVEELPRMPGKDIVILVVEDNVMNQNLMRHLLTEADMQIRVAQNGAEAIEEVKAHRYDLILMDIQMPEMNGYMATQIIRNELHLTIPIVALTAHAMAGEREKCLSYGMNEYISKPINEKELYAIIERMTKELPNDLCDRPVSSAPVFATIDMHYLQELSGGNKSFQKAMMEQFVTQFPGELQAFEVALDKENYEDCKQIAHNMKTSVSFMGLTKKLDDTLNYIEEHVLQEKDSVAVINHFIYLKSIGQKALAEAGEFLNYVDR